MSDVTVVNHGSLYQLFLSEEAWDWVNENVEYEAYMTMGNTLCVEHRYIDDILNGMESYGLEVEGRS